MDIVTNVKFDVIKLVEFRIFNAKVREVTGIRSS